jgi:hypothetical protein
VSAELSLSLSLSGCGLSTVLGHRADLLSGTFEGSGIEWWEKSWGNYFATFNEFLGFGWEVMGESICLGRGSPREEEECIWRRKMRRKRRLESLTPLVVVDSKTGRSHIAVRSEQIGLFARMIRTR